MVANRVAERNRLFRNEPQLKQALNALTGRRLAKPTEAELAEKLGPKLKNWFHKAVGRTYGIATEEAGERWRQGRPVSLKELYAAKRNANRLRERLNETRRALANAEARLKRKRSPSTN